MVELPDLSSFCHRHCRSNVDLRSVLLCMISNLVLKNMYTFLNCSTLFCMAISTGFDHRVAVFAVTARKIYIVQY